MARQRRGGFRPPELRGTLGTLLRTTTGVVRDALERGAREGRSRLDEVMSGRRRSDALAELGEIVLDLIRRGEIDLGELPEVADLVAHLDEIDAGGGHADEPDEPPPRAPLRKRFDDRPTRAGRPRSGDADDGTVSSSTWAPPNRAKPKSDRVWRPTAAHVDETPTVVERPERANRPSAAPTPGRKGGITFDDDDLADYMHPDDVPPKGPPDSDS